MRKKWLVLYLAFVSLAVWGCFKVHVAEAVYVPIRTDGEEVTITTMEIHDTSFEPGCNELLGQHDEEASKNSVYAYGATEVNQYLPDGSTIGQGVSVEARVGLQINWIPPDSFGWEEVSTWPVKITINYSYTFEVSNTGCCGHANAWIVDPFTGGDFADFLASINQGDLSKNINQTKALYTTVGNFSGGSLIISAGPCTRSMPPGHLPGPASSKVSATFHSLKIEFLPEINVKRGTTNIPIGGSYNFGVVNLGVSKTLMFTIENTGSADLLLTETPRVALGGIQAGSFSVTQQPASPVAPSQTTTFSVKFAPKAVGTRTATVSIANNDSDEDPYTFTVIGSGRSSSNSYLLWTQ